MRRFGAFHLAALVAGFAFLYLPIVALVAYSFNTSRLVTVWGASRRIGTERSSATSHCSTPPG